MLAALAGGVARPGWPTRSAAPAPASIGDILEGDAPWPVGAPDALPTAAVERRAEAAAADALPQPEGYALGFDHYATPAQIVDFLRQLEGDYPDLVELTTIGTSWEGRPIVAVRVTNERLPQPVADRPAMVVDGQHHARELVSAAVPLHTIWTLLAGYGRDPVSTYLVDSRVFYAVPSVNVDGNHRALVDDQAWRKTANPTCCDDDGDGAVDEDGTLGFGYGAFGVDRWTFDDDWAAAHPDNPFVDDWRAHVVGRPELGLGRFRGAFGGPARALPWVDADGDGAYEEDAIGGVDANRNYDVLWERGDGRVDSEIYHGPSAFSEPETRAMRDFLTGIDRLAVAVSYHSGIDLILHPWGYSTSAPLPDAATYELLGAKGSALTEVHGYPGSPHVWTARGLYSAYGSTLDWVYRERGAFAFAPEVYGGDDTLFIERIGASGAFTVASSIGAAFNPPPDRLLPALDRWTRFATYLLAATPNVELLGAARDGADVVLTIGNDGVLPVDVAVAVHGGTAGDGSPLFARSTPVRLSADQAAVRVPLAALAGHDAVTLTLRARLVVGTAPHDVEVARWRLAIDDRDGVRVTDGRVAPFRDLGAPFGGWWADARFHGRDYTCRPGAPACPPRLEITPPPSPTAGPTQSPAPPSTPAWPSPAPRPTRTPWSPDAPPWLPAGTRTPRPTATASPGATGTARAAGQTIYLPVGWAGE